MDTKQKFENEVEGLCYLPTGWVSSFVSEFKTELFNLLDKNNVVDYFLVVDIKEKWGSM